MDGKLDLYLHLALFLLVGKHGKPLALDQYILLLVLAKLLFLLLILPPKLRPMLLLLLVILVLDF